MKKAGKYAASNKRAKGRSAAGIVIAILCILAVVVAAGGYFLWYVPTRNEANMDTLAATLEKELPAGTAGSANKWKTGYIAAAGTACEYYDENGAPLGALSRGTQVKYRPISDTAMQIFVNGSVGFLGEGAAVVSDAADIIPVHTRYVRTAVNLRDLDGRLLPVFAEKGQTVEVTGYDYMDENAQAHMYRVSLDGQEGYMMPWYLAENEGDALANFDDGDYATHQGRENRYGGGGAADLDYYPREKGPIAGNEMPSECRTLYLVNWRLSELDSYLEIAENSGINAFVVDILDGGSIGYAGDVMKQYCPSGAAAANNTVEDYKAAIQKLKDAGYYVIGRITTFNDSYFVEDHPECAITDTNGDPLKLSGAYWPTPYNRIAWQYKVDLAVEAVEVMGFHEIQFDYVRFPDLTWSYEEAGTIDFHNTYGETKAQAIQRF